MTPKELSESIKELVRHYGYENVSDICYYALREAKKKAEIVIKKEVYKALKTWCSEHDGYLSRKSLYKNYFANVQYDGYEVTEYDIRTALDSLLEENKIKKEISLEWDWEEVDTYAVV